MTNRGSEAWSVGFRREREADWHALSGLVDRVLGRGLRSLSPEEARSLPGLYERAVSSLSVARETALDRALVVFLDRLVKRSYIALYGTVRPTDRIIYDVFVRGVPRAVTKMLPELSLSFLVTAVGVIVAFLLVRSDPEWYWAFVAPELAAGRDPTAATGDLRAMLYDNGGQDASGLAFFASFLFVHNSQIALLALGLGIAAGVPTVVLLFQNGLMLGAFMALYDSRGLLPNLLGWLGPHGIPEITAVILAGAGGLAIARGVIFPGKLSVADSVSSRGRFASSAAIGAVALLVLAGFFEGVLRQTVTNDFHRVGLSCFTGLVTFVWLGSGIFIRDARGAQQPARREPPPAARATR